MTMSICNEWLQKWDKQLDRNILLLVDNCTAHVVQIPLRRIQVPQERYEEKMGIDASLQMSAAPTEDQIYAGISAIQMT